ncbi:MAG: LytTR family DNA-binding domain-containing protein [Chitinophagaceae bacterium]
MSHPLKCVIADDEPGAHNILRRYIEELPETELIGSCFNALEVHQLLKSHHADILLLDINMPEIDGFALLDMLPEPPAVIITTAYSDYAMKSYEYDAVDYLHKPIRFERFIKAIDKASRRLDRGAVQENISELDIKVDGKMVRIPTSEIIYLQSMGNYVKLVGHKKNYITAGTTREIEQKLPMPQFIRIHKSYIVNTSQIKEVKSDQVITPKETLPLGKTFKKYLETFYGKTQG